MGEVVCRQIPTRFNVDPVRINALIGAGVNINDVSRAYVDYQDNLIRTQLLQINNDLLLQIGTEVTNRINNDNTILDIISELDARKINDVLIDGVSVVTAGKIASIPLATPDRDGAMSALDKEQLNHLAGPIYFVWTGNKYEFMITPETFTADKFPTIQAVFLQSNTLDNPVIFISGQTFDIYVAGQRPKASDFIPNDTCMISFKAPSRADVFALDYPRAYSISSVPSDTPIATEKAVKNYVDAVQFATSALGQGVWYYTSATTLGETKPSATAQIPFALSGTTAATRTFTGTFSRAGFFSPTASYIKHITLDSLRAGTGYNIAFEYRIKGTVVWTYAMPFTANNAVEDITINIPSSSTYANKINWVVGDTYTEVVTINKTQSGNNHTVNILQSPSNGVLSFMQRNGGVVYSGDVFDASLNRGQDAINSGTPTTTISASAGVLTLNYLTSKMFKTTATGNMSIVLSNMPSGMTNVVGVELTSGGAYIITHPTGTKFSGGTAPVLAATGKDILLYMYDGTDVFCNAIKDVK